MVGLLAPAVARAALPEPPKQRESWTPPSTTAIPDFVVKVTAELFQAGLADPRGGVYRNVEIFGSGKNTIQTHAWVFPGEFAVCWNGLVYRVKSVGAPANLEQDVQTILSAKPWSARSRFPFPAPGDSDYSNAPFWSDPRLSGTVAPAPIALLFRLGRADLAEKLWVAPEAPTIAGRALGAYENEEGLWRVTAFTAWFATAYWRLVGAFGGGNDREAADVGESILEWRSRVPESWRVLNGEVPKRVPDISFLNPVPELAADARRRLSELERETLDLSALAADKARSAEFFRRPGAVRVTELIEILQDVKGANLTPGPLIFMFDPDYELLNREGDAAVDALIDAYENDRRLTRTFDYSRPWSTWYTPVRVHQVIALLLNDLVGDSDWSGKSPAELRLWWRQLHSSTRAERSLEMLADDNATPQQWLESADFLTTRSDLQGPEGDRVSPAGACDPDKPAPAVNGEAFRTRRNPSIGELLARRTATLVAEGSDAACGMSVKAALWDGTTALPVLQEAATLRSCRGNYMVAIARLSLGDQNAAFDWANELPNDPAFPPPSRQELAPL